MTQADRSRASGDAGPRRLVAECQQAFHRVREARGLNEVIAALEALVLNTGGDHQEIRAMVARIATFHQLASDIRKIG